MMTCDRCGCDVEPQDAVRETRCDPPGAPSRYGHGMKVVSIMLCPACARCQRGSVGFVLRVILATTAAVVLFALFYQWLN